MKTKVIRQVVTLVISMTGILGGYSQGFINLDFEHPVLPLNPDQYFQVATSNAMPGWTAYTYGSATSAVYYNTLSLGAAAVSLQGPGSLNPPIQGNYSVILQGSTAEPTGSAAIGQTGQIPSTALSLMFWGYANVSFNGQPLALVVASTAANYNVYEADVSTLAGKSGQLLFTAPPFFQGYVDNIQFLSTPVPEPATWALFVCGAGFLAFRRKRLL